MMGLAAALRSLHRLTNHRQYHRSTIIGTFFQDDHPFIAKYANENMYTQKREKIPKTLTHTDLETSSAVIHAKLSLNIPASSIRYHLKKQSESLLACIFFYNEVNPHIGLINNVKEILYNYFQLIGPVKKAWVDILRLDSCLFRLLYDHTEKSQLSSENQSAVPVAAVAVLLENLESKISCSSCKYKSTVHGNILQFSLSNLSRDEMNVLEILAQYSDCYYEIV